MKFNTYIILGLACSFLSSCLAESDVADYQQYKKVSLVNHPIHTVQSFYNAVQNHDCDKAKNFRPGYSVKSCNEIDSLTISKMKLYHINETGDMATVLLDISYQKNGQSSKNFKGYVTLSKKDKNWIIVNDSYKSVKDLLQTSEVANTLTEPQPASSHYVGSGFGSDIILKKCWNESELRGSKADKKVVRPVSNPNRQPPLRKEPRYHLDYLRTEWHNSIRYVETDEKVVALTFDLCERTLERTGYDAEIVNYLRDNRIKATFYAGGKWMRSHPEKTMQLMADPLFEIGNHAWTHGNMAVLRKQKMKKQISWTQAQYELLREELGQKNCVATSEFDKIPPVPLTFRFPYGRCDTESLNVLAKYGLPAIQWNVVTADPWSKQTVKGIVNAVSKIRPGSIIIAHANGRGHKTAKALPKVIKKIKAQGYQFVTVTELLNSAKKVVTKKTCYELKPGDNKRYDGIFGEGTE